MSATFPVAAGIAAKAMAGREPQRNCRIRTHYEKAPSENGAMSFFNNEKQILILLRVENSEQSLGHRAERWRRRIRRHLQHPRSDIAIEPSQHVVMVSALS